MSRRARIAPAAALALALTSVALAAAAQPAARVTLTWTAPASCPSQDDVVREIDRILGESSARADKPLEVRATVDGADGAYRVRLDIGPEGVSRPRTVQGRSCAAVADAAALVIALVIDPTVVPKEKPAPVDAPATPPAAPPTAPAPTPPPPAPPSPTLPSTPSRSPPSTPTPSPSRTSPRTAAEPLFSSVRLGASFAADAGSLPGAGAGFSADAALALRWLRLELGFVDLPSRTALVSDGTAGGTVALWAATVSACAAFPVSRLELGPCVGAEVGRIHASGFGVTDPGAGASVWSAAKAGALASWFPFTASRRSGTVGFTLRLDALAPFTRPTFTLENVGVGAVHQPSALVGRLGLGVEARL